MPSDYTSFIADNLFLVALFLILLTAIIITETKKLTKKYKDLTPAQAVQLLNRENAVMIDVREVSELSGDGIRDAKHMSFSTLTNRLAELLKAKDKPVIAFCMNGFKSSKACRLLCKQGFTKVYCLKGGIVAWKDANMPVVKK
ncbi:MAG: rhodanese-like domain-containing protein [Chromatiales bacterium]|nr:rhodanese-like domain-containing protein [Chromatiales bacterium]